MSNRIEVRIGEVYGRLTVLREVSTRYSGKARHPQRCVECKCECGEVKEYRLYALRNGNTRSCGCLARELAGSGLRTHGLSHTEEYGIWQGMCRRCTDPGDAVWKNYGGRGIRVCSRWLESFESFYEDMGPRPSPKHSINRIDNDGDYEPGNCNWATQKEQARNTRVNYLVEHNGETKCVAEWAEVYGFSPSVLYNRLVSLGWTFEKAVSCPVARRQPSKLRDPFYQTPRKARDAAWDREHARREAIRIESDRRELSLCGNSLAKTHRVDASEFKSRVDTALLEGWTWNGSVFRALREMGAVK